MHSITFRVGTAITACVFLCALAGCSTTNGGANSSLSVGATQATALTVSDSWVKAAKSGMSAAFGILTNTGNTDITVVSAASPASPELELHESLQDPSQGTVMRQKPNGLVIPAHGSSTLKSGGDHIMLMNITSPLSAGDEVTFTLTCADGSTVQFTAPVKDFTGANEHYEGGTDNQ